MLPIKVPYVNSSKVGIQQKIVHTNVHRAAEPKSIDRQQVKCMESIRPVYTKSDHLHSKVYLKQVGIERTSVIFNSEETSVPSENT